MEVNSSPSLEGIETVTEKDIVGRIIEFIENYAKPGQTKTRGKESSEFPFFINAYYLH